LVGVAAGLSLAPADYTAATWRTYADAYTDAYVVARDADADPAAVAAATAALRAAIVGLEPVIRTAALSEAIAAVSGLDLSPYTAASAALVVTARLVAAAELAEPTSQGEIDQVLGALKSAMAGLTPRLATGELHALVTAYDSLGLDGADFTAASWGEYTNALAAGQAALTTQLSQTTLNLAAARLRAAVVALERVAAPPAAPDGAARALAALLEDCRTLAEADYTAVSWAVLAAARAGAEAVLAGDAGASAEPGAALVAHQALSRAVLGLVARPAAGPEPSGAPSGDPSAGPSAGPSQPPSVGPPATAQPTATTQPTVPGTQPPVDVNSQAVARVAIGQKAVTLVKGSRLRLPGAAYTVGGGIAAATWKSANPKVATVSANGTIRAKKAGQTTITLTAGGKRAKVAVRVLARQPASRAVKAVTATAPRTMTVGGSAIVAASYRPASVPGVKVKYKSSRPAVVTVDSRGVVTARAAGTAVVTVKAGAKTKQLTIRVR
jgi:hypothetical protein